MKIEINKSEIQVAKHDTPKPKAHSNVLMNEKSVSFSGKHLIYQLNNEHFIVGENQNQNQNHIYTLTNDVVVMLCPSLL